ncbi:MAG: hypothetical protein HOL79_00820 [Euryarchaeota archaeon]|jgi:hypothetical protein|nr:hypothetical protein [Euryarchaeota archaeon]
MESLQPLSVEINSALSQDGLDKVEPFPKTNSVWLIIGALASFWLLLFFMSIPCLLQAITEKKMTLSHPDHPGANLASKTVLTCWIVVFLQVVLVFLLITGNLGPVLELILGSLGI